MGTQRLVVLVVSLAMVGPMGLSSLLLSSSFLLDSHLRGTNHTGILFYLHISSVRRLSRRSLSRNIPFLDVDLAFLDTGGNHTYGNYLWPIHVANVPGEEAAVTGWRTKYHDAPTAPSH